MSDQVRVRKAAGARASLKVPAFRRVWLTVAVASSGMYGVILVAGLYAYELSHSTVLASASYTLILLPAVIVGPMAGSFVDRSDRRKVLRIGILCAVVPLSLLVVCDAAHFTAAWAVLACCVLIGSGRALYSAAWQAYVPDLLSSQDLVAGGSLMQVAQQGGQALGPLMIGVVMKLEGTASGFIACLVLYALALLVTRGMQSAHAHGLKDLPKRAGLLDGVKRIAKARPLSFWMVFVGCHCSLTMAFMGLLPAYATSVLHGAYYDSIMMSVIGVGAILGAGVLAVAPRTVHTGRVAIGSGLFSGLSIVMLGATTSPALAVFACFLAGFSQAMFMALLYAMIQGNAPYDLRGRVAGYSNTLTSAAMSLLSTGFGALQRPFGFSVTLIVPGLAFTAITMVFIARLDLWRDRSGISEPVPLTASPTPA